MHTQFDYSGEVALVTGASGALGSSVADAFADAGATVAAVDVVPPDSDDSHLAVDADRAGSVHPYEADLTDPDHAARAIDAVAADHGGIDCCASIAGTWRGGQPIDETPADEFDLLVAVNLKTLFLTAKHALPHLRDRDGTQGALVGVSSRSSLEGGAGDGPYRATKAGVRRIVESVAAENTGSVRANAIMPSVIDTPMNREMMPDADHASWVDPADIAQVICFLCSDAASVTSGAAVPVYGEA
jgi:NAD(P)-dependent dehydrogenase (short-subunit alcohol dehydrogenase family)